MSDTTITAEERARLRSVLSEHGNPQVEDRIILRLLNTIEQAEPRALRWTHEQPKVAGWYWRKETVADRAHVFHFTGNWEDYGEHWESDRVCQLPLNLNGNLWAGPIPPHRLTEKEAAWNRFIPSPSLFFY